MPGLPPIRVLLSGAAAGAYLVSADDPLPIGRGARVRVYDLSASRHHCRIELSDTGLWVSDLGSTNGTFVNGRAIDRCPLENGDELRLGHASIRVRVRSHRTDPLLQREFSCRACGRAITLETFADGEVLELAGTFMCPGCALRREAEKTDLNETVIRERLNGAGFRDLEPLHGPGAALLFTARRAPLDQPVTLKVLETAGLPQARVTRFIREARIAARLNHPNIVHLHDVGRAEGLLYMVLEHLDGCTLLEDIEAGGAHPPQRALGIALPVARALGYAHREGVLHRDLKPANIMVGPDGMVKLIDFGIARVRRRRRARETPAEPEGPLGTFSYAAPEQLVDAARATELSDIFAFGSTLYHALTGCPPFLRTDQAPHIRSDTPPALGALDLALPETVIEFVERCMAPSPEARIPNAEALVAGVEQAIRDVSGFREAGRHPELLVRYDDARATGEDTRRIARRLRGAESSGGPAFFGRFRGDELVELAQLVELNQKTGLLEVEDEQGLKARAWFADGRAVRARHAEQTGRDALLGMFSLAAGWFHLRVEAVEERAEHDLPLSPILLEVMRRRDEKSG